MHTCTRMTPLPWVVPHFGEARSWHPTPHFELGAFHRYLVLTNYLYSDRLNHQLLTSSAACLSPKRSTSSYGLVCGLSLLYYASKLTFRSSFYCLSLLNGFTRVELMYRWVSPLRTELSSGINHLHTVPRRHLISASLPRNL